MAGKREIKKKSPLGLIVTILLLLAMAGGGWWVYSHYALYRGELMPRNTTLVDLRGQALAEGDLEKARELFPDAHIVRDVTIGGRVFSSDDRDIVTGDFTAADIPAFSDFFALAGVDVSAVKDISAALALREARPELTVFWTVPLGDQSIDGDAEEITAAGVTGTALADALERLPFVHTVTVTDDSLSPAEQKALTERYPDVAFRWAVTLAGERFDQGAEVLSFEGKPLTAEDLDQIGEYLPLLDAAAELRFSGTGLTDAQLMAFADAHPETAVVWDTSLFGVDFSTDAEELCFDDIPLTTEDAARIEALVPYMPELTRVSMQRCGIDNDSMEAIYRRHIDTDGVKFVWMVQVTNRGVPTDQTFYQSYQWTNPNVDYYYPDSNQTFEQLRYCHDMIALDLGHKRLYGDPDMFASMPHLRYLTVPDCAYTALPALGGLQELEFLELYWSCGKGMDISYLKDCPNLKHLNIAYKRIKDDEERATDLATLKSMKQLERLWISNTMYSPADIQALREALPNTQIEVMDALNCVAKGWRDGHKVYFDYRDALHMYYISDESNMTLVNPYTGERSQYEWTNPFR